MKRNKTDNKQDTMTETKTREQQSAESQAACDDNMAEQQAEAADNMAEPSIEEQLAAWHDKYLRLQAEFDNFRKRVQKEKAELIKNGAEKAMLGLLPIVDDFERGLEAIKDSTDADAVKEGMVLIYNKLIKYLESNGVKAIESNGAEFDAEIHEAIATIPAPAPEMKGKVIDTTSKGYTIYDKVLRHPKVVVGE